MRKILETSEYMTPGWAFQHVFRLCAGFSWFWVECFGCWFYMTVFLGCSLFDCHNLSAMRAAVQPPNEGSGELEVWVL